MPGIVVFGRRWSVGSDDLVVPGAFLFILHTIWAVALSFVLWASDWDEDSPSSSSPSPPTSSTVSPSVSPLPTVADAASTFPYTQDLISDDSVTASPLSDLLTPAVMRMAALLGPALTRAPTTPSPPTTPMPASSVLTDGMYTTTPPLPSAASVELESVHTRTCARPLRGLTVAALALTLCAMVSELAICLVAMRGSILDTRPRAAAEFLIYARLGLMGVELVWLCLGIVWLCIHYADCPVEVAKEALLGLVISNWCVICSVVITVWCTYDAAGRSWVKMKKYQRSVRDAQQSRFQYKRSGNRNRNWRQRKVIRAYQDSWDHRCRLLFCCMGNSDRNRNSFADIARLLSDFFRDLDVVPSDVIAGLVILRKSQKQRRQAIVGQRVDGTYDFLSGAAVTSSTKFVALSDPATLESFQEVVHYMSYALAAYGWPMYVVTNSATAVCSLCTSVRCCACFPCCNSRLCNNDKDQNADPEIVEDKCHCNYVALQKIMESSAAAQRARNSAADGDENKDDGNTGKSGKCSVDVVYATYHVDVGETPFFVAVDYAECKVVISIRGTLSMKDVITDLNAEGEPLPLSPPRDDWLGHKGMVQAAEYIRGKLNGEGILERAFGRDTSRGTQGFGLVLVGHSLGAGTAAILAILMRGEFPGLHCYAYSPPGGLLSLPAVEYTKEFITSIVVGKDVVPRIGLHQLESLRTDLIRAIQHNKEPKWKTITGGVVCCACQTGGNPSTASSIEIPPFPSNEPTYRVEDMSGKGVITDDDLEPGMTRSRCNSQAHPTDSSIALTVHQPLYPPGKIIHIVRHHPRKGEQVLNKHEPVYQALWANNTDFDEVLISPVMIQDHMPDKVLEALNKVISGYWKPQQNSVDENDQSESRL